MMRCTVHFLPCSPAILPPVRSWVDTTWAYRYHLPPATATTTDFLHSFCILPFHSTGTGCLRYSAPFLLWYTFCRYKLDAVLPVLEWGCLPAVLGSPDYRFLRYLRYRYHCSTVSANYHRSRTVDTVQCIYLPCLRYRYVLGTFLCSTYCLISELPAYHLPFVQIPRSTTYVRLPFCVSVPGGYTCSVPTCILGDTCHHSVHCSTTISAMHYF